MENAHSTSAAQTCGGCEKTRRAWAEGLGTALKPSHEPIVLARKPLEGTVAANVARWGTGGLNIDGCRILSDPSQGGNAGTNGAGWGMGSAAHINGSDAGRWPANVLFDEDAAGELDAQSGVLKSGEWKGQLTGATQTTGVEIYGKKESRPYTRASDSGGASRFFYVAKPSRKERDEGCAHLPAKSGGEATDREDGSIGTENPRAGAGRTGGARNYHPTVKPVELMRYLVRLITPVGGVVLDPFLGSGTTGVASILEGFDFIGVELTPEYTEISKARITHALKKEQ